MHRWRGLLSLFALILVSWCVASILELSLRPTQFLSGWILLLLVFALALFNVRKKIPILPLGRAATWMQLHAYAGLFTIFVFLGHVAFRMPNGALELLLALLFVLASGSGIIGLLLSRLLPLRLAARGETILFERIPALRAGLGLEVEDLVFQSTSGVQTSAITRFYAERLGNFFRKPCFLVDHLLDSTRSFRHLERELWALTRYVSPREREMLTQIGERMRLKNDLDYQHAQQLALKGWLFVHVPVTYAFLILAVLHALLAHGFGA